VIKKIFTVYDEKAEAYLQPFFFNTIGQAVRAITDLTNDVNHEFCKHASDYTLFCLGEFDELNGTFHGEKKPLGNLVEFKTVYQNSDGGFSDAAAAATKMEAVK
jgi:hypothetical protein